MDDPFSLRSATFFASRLRRGQLDKNVRSCVLSCQPPEKGAARQVTYCRRQLGWDPSLSETDEVVPTVGDS